MIQSFSNSLKVKDWVVVLSLVNPSEDATFPGTPIQIKAIDHPFVIVQNFDGTFFTFDLRHVILKKCSDIYVQVMIEGLNGEFHNYIPDAQKRSDQPVSVSVQEELESFQEKSNSGSVPTCPRCGAMMGREDGVFHCSTCDLDIGSIHDNT